MPDKSISASCIRPLECFAMLCGSPERRLISAGSKRHPLTAVKERAVVLGTAVAVVDAVAIADAEPVLGAKQPNRLLDQAWEDSRAIGAELAGVDVLSRLLNDAGAPARPVTGRSIGVLGPEAAQGPGSVQPVVHERVHRDHARAGRHPAFPVGVGPE